MHARPRPLAISYESVDGINRNSAARQVGVWRAE